jgi:hypothetical protein
VRDAYTGGDDFFVLRIPDIPASTVCSIPTSSFRAHSAVSNLGLVQRQHVPAWFAMHDAMFLARVTSVQANSRGHPDGKVKEEGRRHT